MKPETKYLKMFQVPCFKFHAKNIQHLKKNQTIIQAKQKQEGWHVCLWPDGL